MEQQLKSSLQIGLLQGTFVWEGAEQLYYSRDIFWHCTLQLFVFHSVEIVELLGMTEKMASSPSKGFVPGTGCAGGKQCFK